MDVIETLPMVPLRDLVIFPHAMIPFVVGRPSSIKALEYGLVKGKKIFVSAQHDATRDNPGPDEIYTLGTICNIVQSLKLPDGNLKVLVEGLDRGRALEFKDEGGFLKVVTKLIPRQVEEHGLTPDQYRVTRKKCGHHIALHVEELFHRGEVALHELGWLTCTIASPRALKALGRQAIGRLMTGIAAHSVGACEEVVEL
jgi:ATP-dependent Lon protease